MDANAYCLDFKSVCGTIGESLYEFGLYVFEWNVFVHKGDEATTTPRVVSFQRVVWFGNLGVWCCLGLSLVS